MVACTYLLIIVTTAILYIMVERELSSTLILLAVLIRLLFHIVHLTHLHKTKDMLLLEMKSLNQISVLVMIQAVLTMFIS